MTTKKQKQIEEQQRRQNQREIAGLCMIALALFLGVSVYSDALGVIPEAIGKACFALFGIVGYAVPVLLFAAGLLLIIFSVREGKLSLRICYIIGFVCVLVVLHAYAKPEVQDVKVWDYYKAAYAYGLESHKGGGVLGALLAYPSLLLLGEIGTYIFYFAGIIVILLLVTRISLRSAGEKVGRTIKNGVDTAKVRLEQQHEQRREQSREGDDLFSDDLFDELMDVKKPSPKRKPTQSTRKKPRQAVQNFDLSADMQPVIKPVEEVSIKDIHKVRYTDADLDILPSTGMIERRESKLEQDIDDMISAFQPPQPAPLPEEAKRTRISENAPLTAYKEADHKEKPVDVPAAPVPPTAPPMQPMETTDAALAYQYPPLSILKHPSRGRTSGESPEATGKLLIETLGSFNISARILNISVGPVITRYELQPAQGVRVSRITALSNDIALALAAPRVRIEAPIPGKAAVGIEIPNKDVLGVCLREIIESKEFSAATSPVTFCLGKDIAGKIMVADLARMPHLLIAGSTGSGKSVCINDIITSMVYKSSPSDVRMILIDPKVVELKIFAALPHLFLPVVTDPKKAAGALKWAVMEMEQRYQKMSQVNARDLARYNLLQTDPAEKMPLLVIVIDELADLMMVAAKDVEESICRIAQLGRACGIHLIVATQRPSSDIITGLIKANIPSRIAFMVSSAVDSRVIMDCNGAEKLLGKGDMLFHPNGAGKPIRAQGAFISDEEVEAVMDFFQGSNATPQFKQDDFLAAVAVSEGGAAQGNGKQEDELLGEAVKIVLESGQASISMIQRRLRVGYARAARLIDIMEQHKIVSGFDGSKPRKLLINSYAEYVEMCGEGEGAREE